MRLRKLPLRSGIVTENRASVPWPIAERSVTWRSRSKFILAPHTMAAIGPPLSLSWLFCLAIPATAIAPAGSTTVRVSSYISCMAAQISSVLTVIISSSASWQSR